MRPGDEAPLRTVRLRAFETDPLSFGSTVEEATAYEAEYWQTWVATHAAGRDTCTLLAVVGGDPVGLVRAERENGEVFGVYSMWVAPEVRRRGVAMALLTAVEDWIRSVGGREAELFVVDGVAPAYALYVRAGYALDGRREPSERPGVDELGMRKAL